MGDSKHVLDVDGEGRWLVVENLKVRPISIPHPDRDAADREHLSLSPYEHQVVPEEWLDSTLLYRAVRDGLVRVYRTDDIPDSRPTVNGVVDSFESRGIPRTMALNAYYLCASEPPEGKYLELINLEPSRDSKSKFGETSITQRWDLVQDHLPWLRATLELEKRWRNRRKIVSMIKKRITEIEEMK